MLPLRSVFQPMKTGYFNREIGKAFQLRLPPLLTPSTQGKQASNQVPKASHQGKAISASMKTGYFNRETGKAFQLRLPPLLTPSTQGKQASNQGNAISATILLSLLLTSLLMPSLLLSSNNLRQLQGFHYLLIENTMFVKITCIYL